MATAPVTSDQYELVPPEKMNQGAPEYELVPPTQEPGMLTRISDFSHRVGTRLKQNIDLPAVIHSANNAISEGIHSIGEHPLSGGRLPEVWQALKQYKDPANIAA